MITSNITELFIPDLFKFCPISSSFNAHYRSVRPEAQAWIDTFNFFSGKKREHFIKSDIECLAAHSYSQAGREDFRMICNAINIIYVNDMLTDEQDGVGAMETANLCIKAFTGEECDGSDSALYRCVSELATRVNAKDLPRCKQRFVEHFKEYLYATAQEADLRCRDKALSLEEYRELRRGTSAISICFDLIEFSLGLDLPNEVFEDKAFMRIYWAASDMVSWANDIYSYNIEQSMGHKNANVLTVFMCSHGMTLQEAANHVGKVFEALMKEHLTSRSMVRSFGLEVDNQVEAYLRGLGEWVVGNLEWSFASQRYFGTESDKIRKGGAVKIMTRGVWDEN